MRIALFALLLANLVAFLLMGIDKRHAIRARWRIPERILLLWAVLGGAWGAYIGMRTFHHKTKKPRFSVGVPVLCTLETALFFWLGRLFLF